MHSLAVPSLKRILQTACYFGNIMKFPISGKRIKKKKKKDCKLSREVDFSFTSLCGTNYLKLIPDKYCVL